MAANILAFLDAYYGVPLQYLVMMKGYLKNEKATNEAFKYGWFHSGDLAVKHPDGYIEIRDRSKDIIISGGKTYPL
jgi:long-subunit acyl-CoA synthetase (AMP-forming)